MDRRAELGLTEGVTSPSHKPSRGMAKHIRRLLSQQDKQKTAGLIAQLDGLRSKREARDKASEEYEKTLRILKETTERQKAEEVEREARSRIRYARGRIADIDYSFFYSRDMTPHQRLELDIEACLLNAFVAVPTSEFVRRERFQLLMYRLLNPDHEDYLNESVQSENGLPTTRFKALVGKVLTEPEQAEFGRMWNDYHGIKVTPAQSPR